MINLGKWRLETASAQPKCQALFKESFTCKVYRGYFQDRSDNTPVDGGIQLHSPVPWIQLQGVWLNQLGFPVDMELTVEAAENCIMLRPKLPT